MGQNLVWKIITKKNLIGENILRIAGKVGNTLLL